MSDLPSVFGVLMVSCMLVGSVIVLVGCILEVFLRNGRGIDAAMLGLCVLFGAAPFLILAAVTA